jgi:flagellin-like protein
LVRGIATRRVRLRVSRGRIGSSKIVRRRRSGETARRGIDSIIATVLVVAVTLVASVAVGGFVFGIFGQAQNSAQIAVTGTALTAASFGTGTSGTITCVTSNPATPYLTLTTTGTGAAALATVTITWAGADNAFPLAAATTCPIGSAGTASATTYAEFSATPEVITAVDRGQAFTGTVTLTNGAQLLFSGTWQ